MDQVKEYLNLALKYRFWIAMGIAALLPIAGYFATAGSLDSQRAALESTVQSSHDSVKKYSSGTPVNKQYTPLVKTENETIQKDIDTSWRKLYARQAPYLTWPEDELVQATIPAWAEKYGRDKWPENLDRFAVDEAVRAYVESYKEYVKGVYQVFQPFDPETGDGIVSAPPQDFLLQTPEFDIAKLPSLGKVWAAQEKLWIQRTVLEVIAAVNAKAGAKSWSEAPIKQIVELDVASDSALDQKSTSEGTGLTQAPDILPPGSEPVAADPSAGAAASDLAGGKLGAFMGGGAASKQGGADRPVMYVTNELNADQLNIAPIYLSVYCRQEAIPDLLVEFQNSPMNIQVLEVAVVKPGAFTVKKPKKGEFPSGGGMMGGMMGRGGGRLGGMAEGGYAGGMGGIEQMMGAMGGAGAGTAGGGYGQGNMAGMMRGASGSSGGYSSPSMGSMRSGMGGLGAGKTEEKKHGTDVSAKILAERKAAREKGKKDAAPEEAPESKVSDPYYDVVEVRIYGQARFYKTPPKEEAQVSESGTAADPAAPVTEPADQAAAVPPDATPPTDAAKEAPPGDTAKSADTPAAAGDEATKPAEGAAAAPDAPKPEGETPKDQTKPADAPASAGGDATKPADGGDATKPADGEKPGSESEDSK